MSIHLAGTTGVKGTIEVSENFRPRGKCLDGFSHVIRLYLFLNSQGFKLQVVPFMDSGPGGFFTTCKFKRPNPIGLSVG